MTSVKRFFRTPFGSALVGGAVVAAFGWVAIAAGWVAAEESPTTTVAAPLAAPVAGGGDGGNVVNRIYRRDGQGVAFVEAEGQGQGPPGQPNPFGEPEGEGGGTASGSGFLIDTDGHVVTNSHVVDGASQVTVTLGASDESYPAEIVGTDPATDVALLKVDAPADELHPLALGDSSKVRVGDPVVAIGNPFGLERTVTSGIVSALQRQIQAPNGFSISQVIQTDAAINPGNSGGPLIDAGGDVIGINAQIQTRTGGNVGIGFAIPIDTARDVVEQLREDGEVEHAYLGISGASIDAEIAEALKLPVDEGVLVQEVVAGGPSEDAGVKGGTSSATIDGAKFRVGGDIVVRVDGKRISAMDEIVDIVNGAEPGDRLRLTVRRGGETKTLTVTLGQRPDSAQ